ncbi:MAG TPA: hypothetical protein VLU54_05495, partial [Casimicrobiaceae bacterium]|nr:hypothetical protein [Casimicrobiaceae bacterium]
PTIHERVANSFELDLIEWPNPDGLDLPGVALRPNGWLLMGAIREDDNPEEANPKDDPYHSGGVFHREFNHFFDPYFDRPLTVPLLQTLYGSEPIRRAYDWALGTANALSDPSTRDTQSTWNHFTLFDAREAMFRALTFKQRDAFGGYADLPPAATAAEAESMRKAYWATAFRALGDILHLNQDMAQPQHTRNETHSDKWYLGLLRISHGSVFEKYLDERARQVPRKISSNQTVSPPQLPFDGYPTPSFERYSDFWTSYPGPDSGVFGKGLADYSANGFFTPANNFGDGTYPNPPSIAYVTENIAGLVTTRPDATTRFLRGEVIDRYAGASSNIRLTTESIWNGRLTASGTPVRTYSLNRVNYDDMASLLVPRAVAYSAGLLEHFFRGEMEINPPDAGFYGIVDHAKFAPSQSGSATDVGGGFKGFDKIKLKLRNTTPMLQAGNGTYVDQPMSGGALIAVLKFHRNLCYDDLLTQWPLTGADARSCRSPVEEMVTSDVIVNQSVPQPTSTAPSGTELTFHFPNRELPINAWDVVLQVVYRGRLGTEADAVAVATRNIAEPTFAAFMNATDYVVINGRFYTPADVAARQELFASVLSSCRAGQAGSYTVSTACYNKTDYFTFTAGSSGVAIMNSYDVAIRPRRLARVALLADHASPPQFSWQVDGVSCWIFLSNPLSVQPYLAEMDADGVWAYGRPSTIRSVRAWHLNVCYADIASPETLPGDLDFSQLDNLTGIETEPSPLTIVGWD